MKCSVVLFFIFIFGAGYCSAQTSDSPLQYHFKQYFADSAASSITMERDTVGGFEVQRITTVTPSYHVVSYWGDDNFIPVIISEINKEFYLSNAEGEQGHVTLVAQTDNRGKLGKTIWEISLEANAINYPPDFLEAVYYGCCGAEYAREIIRYSDGKSILMLTSDFFKVSVPNGRIERYVGYLSSNASRDYSDIRDSLLCGVLVYTDPQNLSMQRVAITYKSAEVFDSLGIGVIEKISFMPKLQKDIQNFHGSNELELWSKDGSHDASSFSDFTVDLHCYRDKYPVISIPIKNDRFDISKLHSEFFNFELR